MSTVGDPGSLTSLRAGLLTPALLAKSADFAVGLATETSFWTSLTFFSKVVFAESAFTANTGAFSAFLFLTVMTVRVITALTSHFFLS